MKQFKIGKDSKNEVIIKSDPTVSRVHLAVFIDDEKNIFYTPAFLNCATVYKCTT